LYSIKFVYHIQQHNGIELCLAELKGNVDYTGAEYLKTTIVTHVTEHMSSVIMVVIKGAEINSIDATVADVSNQTPTHNQYINNTYITLFSYIRCRPLFHYEKILNFCIVISFAGTGMWQQQALYAACKRRREACSSLQKALRN